jgi:hypothetical protein
LSLKKSETVKNASFFNVFWAKNSLKAFTLFFKNSKIVRYYS